MPKKKTRKHKNANKRLTEMVMDHVGIPRPGTSEHMKKLQDELLPSFMEKSRESSVLSSPTISLRDPVLNSYISGMEAGSDHIHDLDGILEDLGIHAFLEDMSVSSDAAMLAELPVPLYDERLLKAAGHPDPTKVVPEYLRRAAKKPHRLSSSGEHFEKAGQLTINVYNTFYDPNAVKKETRPRKRKLRGVIKGLTKMFQGLVLVTSNALLVPTVPLGAVTALPGVDGLLDVVSLDDDDSDNTVNPSTGRKPPKRAGK